MEVLGDSVQRKFAAEVDLESPQIFRHLQRLDGAYLSSSLTPVLMSAYAAMSPRHPLASP